MKNDINVIFWGTPEFSVPIFEALVKQGWVRAAISKPSKPKGRGKKDLELSPLGMQAQLHSIPLFTPDRVSVSLKKDLEPYLPATFVVAAYGKIIPEEVLQLSTPGVINVHPSLLPELRGPSPIQSAILEGKKVTGVTLIELDPEMDHGPIIASVDVAITNDDTYESLSLRLSEEAARLTVQKLPEYIRGIITPQAQNHSRATFCKKIESKDGSLDLTQDASQLIRKVKALNPSPGTFIIWNGKRLGIVSAQISKQNIQSPFGIGSDGKLLISCGHGTTLEAHLVQLEGKNVVSSADFVRGQQRFM